ESRNEILAAAFRRYNICEERGAGFEKAIAAIEWFGLPPLKFLETENSFRVIMYAPAKIFRNDGRRTNRSRLST
ncbi:MAG: transcriptional regulator, partial [Candidatus Nephrothrix sp. EaCA]